MPAHPKASDSPKSLYSQSLVPDERINNFHHHKSPTTKIQPLRIFQWNCHSFSNKFEFFRKVIYNYDIGALSETRLRPQNSFYLKGLSIFRKDNTIRNKDGLVLVIRKFIPFEVFPDFFSIPGRLDCQAVLIGRSGWL